jgi:hypothetical protein
MTNFSRNHSVPGIVISAKAGIQHQRAMALLYLIWAVAVILSQQHLHNQRYLMLGDFRQHVQL